MLVGGIVGWLLLAGYCCCLTYSRVIPLDSLQFRNAKHYVQHRRSLINRVALA